MKERPILFNGEMVRAILEGRKTQTRRVMNPKANEKWLDWITDKNGNRLYDSNGNKRLLISSENGKEISCPYGAPDDLLWVRETWQYCPFCGGTNYKAGANDNGRSCQHCDNDLGAIWKPSIHMRYEDSRITLRVVDVRVERVQEISHDDAYNEGVETDIWDQAAVARNYAKPDSWFQMWSSDLPDYVDLDELYRASFRTLWDSINAARGFGWDANPFCWVISFERIEP